MSKGYPRLTIPIPQDLLDQILVELDLQRGHSPLGPEDLSAFVVRAIRERVAWRQRSRAKKPPGRAVSQEVWPEERWTLTTTSERWV